MEYEQLAVKTIESSLAMESKSDLSSWGNPVQVVLIEGTLPRATATAPFYMSAGTGSSA